MRHLSSKLNLNNLKTIILSALIALFIFKANAFQTDTIKHNAKKVFHKDSVKVIKVRQCRREGIDLTNNDTLFFKITNSTVNTIFPKNDSFYLFVYNAEKNLVDVMKYKLFDDFYPGDTFNYKLNYDVNVPYYNSNEHPQRSTVSYYQYNLNNMIQTAQEYKIKADSSHLNQLSIVAVFNEELNNQIEKLSKACSGPFELEIENTMSNSQLNFKLCNNEFGNIIWQITDKSGNVVGNGNIEKSLVEQSYTIMFDNLPKGYYTLSVGFRSDAVTETFKITW